jgi:hypothetical protein
MAVYYSDNFKTMSRKRRNQLRILHILMLIKKDNRRIKLEHDLAMQFIEYVRPKHVTVQMTHEQLDVCRTLLKG